MDPLIQLAILVVCVFAMSVIGTRTVIAISTRNNILRHIDHRSLHKLPTPVGGGWAVLISSLLVWLVVMGVVTLTTGLLIVSAVSLALMSWVDDIKTLPASSRFILQIMVVFGSLYYIPSDSYILSGHLPVWADRLIAGFCWLWFINVFNFMDGMDGLAGSETICVALGIALIGGLVALPAEYMTLSILLASAMAGFLVWNWHPAKVFLGDVGSIPIGFLLGWLLIQLALKGAVLAAFILPLYFLFDASLTLIRRLLRGERIWEAHRQHLYQKAALSGLSHAQVVLRILPANLLLMLSAYVSLHNRLLGVGLAVFSLLMIIFALFVLRKKEGI